jgi:plastocyanin
MAPITGTTHEVKMIGDDKGYRYEPAELTIKQGDGIKFTMVSGGPHNVAFDAATIAADAKTALLANMPEQQGELSSKMLLNADETYTISFAGVPAGTYDFFCTPHLAMNMKGKVTVTQ